ncbi:hypothetical protein [Tessaracoccus palaemonis]|uniref:Uncharacterized protein n=1 Tax=Tessaracoccus palaemonis TaxID=2829499 RepID=A0ABX8SJF6_9ACTN|nr:hypothetical protein [Tessaracoccus palaemonis]QXT63440.1 hypothetical protein KDB89_02875 [Tessaracoccus palaemonis]
MKASNNKKGPGRSKMQDVAEFRRWHSEGRSYKWMQAEYKHKYGLDVTTGMFGNWANRLNLPKRSLGTAELPWRIRHDHRMKTESAMAWAYAREQAGMPVRLETLARYQAWKTYIQSHGWVLHYDPNTEQGFFLVDARPGIDKGVVRERVDED